MSTDPRWSRLEANDRIGREGLERLRGSHVAVVGAGVLGGGVLTHLAVLGVETTIIDRETVSEENGNQGFPEDMVGISKAQARAISLGNLNSAWRAHAVHADLSRIGLGVYAKFDLILSDVDSAAARAAISETAIRVNRPWCDAAVDAHGRPFGRVACYDPRMEHAACYICPHDAASLAAAVSGGVEHCPGARGRGNHTPPTLATPMLAASVAALQVTWAAEMLLGRGAELAGSEAYLDLGDCALRRHRLIRNSRCLFDHRRFAPLEALGAATGELTVAETLKSASQQLGADAQLRIWRDAIACEMNCPSCGASRGVFRLLGALDENETRCECGAEMGAPAAGLLDRFGAAEAEPFADRTWAELGLPECDIIGARVNGREIFLRFE